MKILQVKKYNQLERQKLNEAIENGKQDINQYKTYPNGVFYGFRDEKTYEFKQKGGVCMGENGAKLFKNKQLAQEYFNNN